MEFSASGKQGPDVLPASSYLQERLQERRSRNPRPSRARQSDFGPRTTTGLDDDIFLAEAEESNDASTRLYDSSPLAPFGRHGMESRASLGSASGTTLSAGGRRRRNLGAKELDEQMDRLTKQNFDLKLELDHRREQQARMHAQIESMRGMAERVETLQEEHAELLRINSLLVDELEKRDRAMQEAVDIICDLEEKVDDLDEQKMEQTRPSTAQADSGYAGTETQEQTFSSSPPAVTGLPRASGKPYCSAFTASNTFDGMAQARTPARSKREPSFLSQKKPSTNALRSVFLDAGREIHPVQSFNSILSKQTSRMNDDVPQELHSPRLSVLSESSFPSMYSPRKGISPERHAWEPEDDAVDDAEHAGSSHLRQDSISRVSRWIEDRHNNSATPSKSNRISSPLSARVETPTPQMPDQAGLERFQSLNDALSNNAYCPDGDLLETHQVTKPFLLRGQKGRRALKTPSLLGGLTFGEPLLPPTPESASTRMLRASRSSVMDEKSLLDSTPAQVKNFPALEPRSRATPKQMRSSIELNSAHEHTLPHRVREHATAQDTFGKAFAPQHEREGEENDREMHGEGLHDHRGEYQGYPDGASIADGTPSRFRDRDESSTDATGMLFNMANISPPFPTKPARSVPHRRKSSVDVPSQRKPSITRADTSPTYPHTWGRTANKPPARFHERGGSPTSPIGTQSNASSIRTAIPESSYASASRALSPESTRSYQTPSIDTRSTTPVKTSTGTPKAASIASQKSSLTQRTQQLFRRISSSHADRDRNEQQVQVTPSRRERALSPLPRLTSTPSSAYIDDRPSRVRRPSTSGVVRSPNSPSFPPSPARPGTAPRGVSKDSTALRPNLPGRTVTEPSHAHDRAAGLDVPEGGVEKRRNPFRRGGSLRKAEGERGGSVAGVKKPWR